MRGRAVSEFVAATNVVAAVGLVNSSLFIRKYRTLGCCKSSILKVAHTIENIEPACSVPLPSIHFTLGISQLYQGKGHLFLNRCWTRS